MEDMVTASGSFWRGKRVFLTGHTGFKGGWLALWLHDLGAEVHGFALDPDASPCLFEVARIHDAVAKETRADLNDVVALDRAVANAQPEVVFHLAAQPLVRQSYMDPVDTFSTNVMGTVNLLESVRKVRSVRAVVVITTDKVYQNCEWAYPYREVDRLGGHDPYSASKAAAELVVASYRASFFAGELRHPARLATARAGNVIGGGDWAADRLVPDCLRAFGAGRTLTLRYPDAVRPWQHVFEPLAGYLLLAERLYGEKGSSFECAWNFGPESTDEFTVGEVAEVVAALWGGGASIERVQKNDRKHEAGILRLDINHTRNNLGWTPVWGIKEALVKTIAWEKARRGGTDMVTYSRSQIAGYLESASG